MTVLLRKKGRCQLWISRLNNHGMAILLAASIWTSLLRLPVKDSYLMSCCDQYMARSGTAHVVLEAQMNVFFSHFPFAGKGKSCVEL
jgi:hypothetical protein